MRTLIPTLSAALILVAGAAQAQEVTVVLGPELEAKADDLGQREIDQLAGELQERVAERLAQRGALAGARVELVLADVRPNRPTYEQLNNRPGLSFESVSLGGATIEGRIIAADGSVTPVEYDWYSNNLRDVVGYAVWTDATRTFERFAERLARGRL